jgi:hypothetical protein
MNIIERTNFASGKARGYLQPDGVIVFPGAHDGFAAGLSGGGGGLTEAATAGFAGGGGGGFTAAAGPAAGPGLASTFDDLGTLSVFCFACSLAGSFLSKLLERA